MQPRWLDHGDRELCAALAYTFYVLALLILFLGVTAFRAMPTHIFPEIDIPVVSVIWQYAARDYRPQIHIGDIDWADATIEVRETAEQVLDFRSFGLLGSGRLIKVCNQWLERRHRSSCAPEHLPERPRARG